MGINSHIYTWPFIHHLYQIYAHKFYTQAHVELCNGGNPPLHNTYAYRHIEDQKYLASAECKGWYTYTLGDKLQQHVAASNHCVL